jgi:scyllo-inositol 2-dehydrogenase (NAD+)
MLLPLATRLRAAVIGCGGMGAFTRESLRKFLPPGYLPLNHAEAILAQSELELVGLCDVSFQKLEEAQERYGGVPGFTDHRALLDAIHPDVLTVATRTPERSGIITDALATGVRGMHLEKPLCNSVSQLTELESLLAPASIVCTYGAIRRYMPIYRRARVLLEERACGDLQQIHVCMGKSPLFWTHPHSIDLILFFAGDKPVERISAQFEAGSVVTGRHIDGDPIVQSVLIEFKDGVTGLISQTGGCDVTLACSEGMITVESDGRRLNLRRAYGDDFYWDAVTTEYPDGKNGGTRLALDRLVKGLRGDESNIAADKRAILMGQRLLLACGQSYLSGGAAIDPHYLDNDIVISGRSGNRYA